MGSNNHLCNSEMHLIKPSVSYFHQKFFYPLPDSRCNRTSPLTMNHVLMCPLTIAHAPPLIISSIKWNDTSIFSPCYYPTPNEILHCNSSIGQLLEKVIYFLFPIRNPRSAPNSLFFWHPSNFSIPFLDHHMRHLSLLRC